MNSVHPGSVPAIRALLAAGKICHKERLLLREANNHTGWLKDDSKVTHNSKAHPQDLKFELALNENDHSKHELKLFTNMKWCTGPLLHYDSKGPSHRNRTPDTPLHQQKISTPHFQTYDDQGFSFAYKTPALKRKSSLIEKPTFALVEFFREVKMKCKGNSVPSIGHRAKLFHK